MTDWFDDLPTGWDVSRLKNIIESMQTGVWGDDPRGDDDDIRCVRVADFDRPRSAVGSVETFRSVPQKDREGRLLALGDILLEKSGGTDNNPVGFSVMFAGAYPAVSSNFITRLRIKRTQLPRFWLYALDASYATKRTERSVRRTTGIQNLDQKAFLNDEFPVPPLAEQRAIADFLDRETVRIDTLIEEQRRLIDLLQERRRSVISGALAPREGWRTGRIKHLGSTSLGKMLDAGRANRDGDRLRPYVRAADVLANGTVNLADLNEMPFSDAEMGHFDLRAEDILLIEGGATVGRPGFLYDGADGIAFQKTVNRLRVGTSMSARFCYWVLLRLYVSGYYVSHFGAVSFVHLTGEKLREIELAFPELVEQRTIAAYLDEETSKVDALIAETARFIDLARERRAALITAAVTGQIDVQAAEVA